MRVKNTLLPEEERRSPHDKSRTIDSLLYMYIYLEDVYVTNQPSTPKASYTSASKPTED
jgi:hypothetical protein